jgi:hypothetical protein
LDVIDDAPDSGPRTDPPPNSSPEVDLYAVTPSPFYPQLPAVEVPAAPPPPVVRLYELYAWLAAKEVTAYPPPATMTPAPEVEPILVSVILGDLAGARGVEEPTLRGEVVAWLGEHPVDPPGAAAPPLPAVSPAPRRSQSPRLVHPLCERGCCFECDACASKPGIPILCEACQERRAACGLRHRAGAAGTAEKAGEPQGLDAARQRVGADLRRISVGIFELSSALRDKTRWGLRHGIAGAETALEKGGEAVAGAIDHFTEQRVVAPLVARVMQLAAWVDGGPTPESARREAVLSMIYGPDKSRWPAWIRLDG